MSTYYYDPNNYDYKLANFLKNKFCYLTSKGIKYFTISEDNEENMEALGNLVQLCVDCFPVDINNISYTEKIDYMYSIRPFINLITFHLLYMKVKKIELSESKKIIYKPFKKLITDFFNIFFINRCNTVLNALHFINIGEIFYAFSDITVIYYPHAYTKDRLMFNLICDRLRFGRLQEKRYYYDSSELYSEEDEYPDEHYADEYRHINTNNLIDTISSYIHLTIYIVGIRYNDQEINFFIKKIVKIHDEANMGLRNSINFISNIIALFTNLCCYRLEHNKPPIKIIELREDLKYYISPYGSIDENLINKFLIPNTIEKNLAENDPNLKYLDYYGIYNAAVRIILKYKIMNDKNVPILINNLINDYIGRDEENNIEKYKQLFPLLSFKPDPN